MPNHHFVAKLIAGGGPPPLAELENIILQVGDSEEPLAWLATRKPGAGWQQRDDSLCIAFFDNREHDCIDAVVAKIVGRQIEMPKVPAVRELHEGHFGFQAWWQLAEPVRLRFTSLDTVPGLSKKGRSARQTFSGSNTFAYWSFDDRNNPRLFDSVVATLSNRGVRAEPSFRQAEERLPVSTPAPRTNKEQISSLPGRTNNLYGVDFSGGRETARGNPKIWIASWLLGQKTLTLRCGTDGPALCRSNLAEHVRRTHGWWALDFPFGVAKETASAILETPDLSWSDWLRWCAGGPDATERRDLARKRTDAARVRWSTRRSVDDEHGTTWFPLFEQLYRQTIYGCGEVLLPLFQQKRSEVRVLPWHHLEDAPVVVTEGFPGITIRGRLNLAGSGYKGSRVEHRHERQRILDALMREPYFLPIPPNVQTRAEEDTEGDAVDALVLLIAAWASQTLDSATWQECRQELENDDRLIEGWFPE